MNTHPFNNRMEAPPYQNVQYSMGPMQAMMKPQGYGNHFYDQNWMGYPQDKPNQSYQSREIGQPVMKKYPGPGNEYKGPKKINEFITQKKSPSLPAGSYSASNEHNSYHNKAQTSIPQREKSWSYNKQPTSKKPSAMLITQQFKFVCDDRDTIVASYEEKNPFDVLNISFLDDINVHFYLINLSSFKKSLKEFYNEIVEEADRLGLDLKELLQTPKSTIVKFPSVQNFFHEKYLKEYAAGIELGPLTKLESLNESKIEFFFDYQGVRKKVDTLLSWKIFKANMKVGEDGSELSERKYLLRKIDELSDKPKRVYPLVKWSDWLTTLQQKQNFTSFIPGLKITAFIFDDLDTVDFFPNISCYVLCLPEKWNNDNLLSMMDQNGLSKPYQIIRNSLENSGAARLNFLSTQELNDFLSHKLTIDIVLNEKHFKKPLITFPCTSRESYLNLLLPYQVILACEGNYFSYCRDKQYLVKQIERLFGMVADINFLFKKDECLVTFATVEAAQLCVNNKFLRVFNREFTIRKLTEEFPPVGKLYYDNFELSFQSSMAERFEDRKHTHSVSVRAETPFFIPRNFLNGSTEFAERYVQMLKLQEEESINNRNLKEEEFRGSFNRDNYPWEKFLKEEPNTQTKQKPSAKFPREHVLRDSLQINQKINMNFNIPQNSNIIDNFLLNSNGVATRIDRTYYINHDSDQPLKDTPDVIQVNPPGKHQTVRNNNLPPPITIINTPNNPSPVVLKACIPENPAPTTHFAKGTKKLNYKFDPELEEEFDKWMRNEKRINFGEGEKANTRDIHVKSENFELEARKNDNLHSSSRENAGKEDQHLEASQKAADNKNDLMIQIKMEDRDNFKASENMSANEPPPENSSSFQESSSKQIIRNTETSEKASGRMDEESYLDFDKLNETRMVQSPTKGSVESLVITLDGDSDDEDEEFAAGDNSKLVLHKSIRKRDKPPNKQAKSNKAKPEKSKSRPAKKGQRGGRLIK